MRSEAEESFIVAALSMMDKDCDGHISTLELLQVPIINYAIKTHNPILLGYKGMYCINTHKSTLIRYKGIYQFTLL